MPIQLQIAVVDMLIEGRQLSTFTTHTCLHVVFVPGGSALLTFCVGERPPSLKIHVVLATSHYARAALHASICSKHMHTKVCVGAYLLMRLCYDI
jgi:hypothetical protein|mmetsp:Transcript_16682/g.26519  ORF Transcript_16682/g.26519 Transcript_16682/m.26519 type:complete len:95 (-) Transcript_16682:36-320(-)